MSSKINHPRLKNKIYKYILSNWTHFEFSTNQILANSYNTTQKEESFFLETT